MQQPIATPYSINDFLEWHFSGQLVIAPKFQRRDVWIPKAKAYLIDTILRSMPIPPVFIRLNIDPVKRRTVREVVDGQQRIRAVLSYFQSEFPILKVHNAEFAGMTYANLSEDTQKSFLSYRFMVNVLEDVSDSDVLNIFARLNTYTVKLNAQELRNAEFFGAFKQTVYRLALEHYAFWRNNNVVTDMQIARMDEVELVSNLVVSMIDGIRQTKTKDLKHFYKLYDDEFADSDKVTHEFGLTIDTIGDIFKDTLKSSPFRRTPLFYSLFCAIYDARFGLPGSKRPRVSFGLTQNRRIGEKLHHLGNIITSRDPPQEYLHFIDATRLSTADVGKRRIRHDFIWDRVLAEAA